MVNFSSVKLCCTSLLVGSILCPQNHHTKNKLTCVLFCEIYVHHNLGILVYYLLQKGKFKQRYRKQSLFWRNNLVVHIYNDHISSLFHLNLIIDRAVPFVIVRREWHYKFISHNWQFTEDTYEPDIFGGRWREGLWPLPLITRASFG